MTTVPHHDDDHDNDEERQAPEGPALAIPAGCTVGLDGLVPHELRHGAASLALRSGTNMKVVQTTMGHASVTVTWDLCGYLYDDDLDGVVRRGARGLPPGYLRASCGPSQRCCQAGKCRMGISPGMLCTSARSSAG